MIPVCYSFLFYIVCNRLQLNVPTLHKSFGRGKFSKSRSLKVLFTCVLDISPLACQHVSIEISRNHETLRLKLIGQISAINLMRDLIND